MFLLFSVSNASLLLVLKIVLAALGCFGSPYFGFGTTRPWLYIGGGLALFILLVLLILGI